MKRLVMVIALASALSGTVMAGNIPTGGIVSPPTEVPGEIPSTDYMSSGEVRTVGVSALMTVLHLAF